MSNDAWLGDRLAVVSSGSEIVPEPEEKTAESRLGPLSCKVLCKYRVLIF
jgi:hypothetical protein